MTRAAQDNYEEEGDENHMNGDDAMQEDGPSNTQGQPEVDAGVKQPNQDRITTPYMTKYERARVLGTRALQIRSVGVLAYS